MAEPTAKYWQDRNLSYVDNQRFEWEEYLSTLAKLYVDTDKKKAKYITPFRTPADLSKFLDYFFSRLNTCSVDVDVEFEQVSVCGSSMQSPDSKVCHAEVFDLRCEGFHLLTLECCASHMGTGEPVMTLEHAQEVHQTTFRLFSNMLQQLDKSVS